MLDRPPPRSLPRLKAGRRDRDRRYRARQAGHQIVISIELGEAEFEQLVGLGWINEHEIDRKRIAGVVEAIVRQALGLAPAS